MPFKVIQDLRFETNHKAVCYVSLMNRLTHDCNILYKNNWRQHTIAEIQFDILNSLVVTNRDTDRGIDRQTDRQKCL